MSTSSAQAEPCPCGIGPSYHGCCGPLHTGDRRASTAEALMRSRYAAYAVGDADYLWRSWHPRTRPQHLDIDPDVRWTGLEIVEVVDGADGDQTGVVEFRAHYRDAGQRRVLRERSRFAVRGGRWLYLDAEI